MAANVDTGCDMTEEEILAMLKGISVKRQEARDVDAVTASATDNAGTRAAAVDAADDGDAPAAGGDETRLVAKFLARNPEKHAINQYWYSPATIACLAPHSSPVRSASPCKSVLVWPSSAFTPCSTRPWDWCE